VFFENLRDHKFDAASAAWASDLQSDPFQLWHSSSIQNRGSNFISFKNAEADDLIEKARLEFDPEKRKQLYWRLQEIMHEEQPYTFVYYPEEAAAYQKRFQNVIWMPARPSYDLTAWFVPRMAQRYTAVPQ
jgi:peptide/nickel transport system substrate-binding protein